MIARPVTAVCECSVCLRRLAAMDGSGLQITTLYEETGRCQCPTLATISLLSLAQNQRRLIAGDVRIGCRLADYTWTRHEVVMM